MRKLITILSSAAVAAVPIHAVARDITVTTTTDDGAGSCGATCTLRDALASAEDGDVVLFDGAVVLDAAKGPLTSTRTVTIRGTGAASASIGATGQHRLVNVNGGGCPD